MASYKFRFLSGGKAMFVADHQYADDFEALDDAEFLAQDFDIEVWRGSTMVARVKHQSATPAATLRN